MGKQLISRGTSGWIHHQTIGEEVKHGSGPFGRVFWGGRVVDGDEQEGTQRRLTEERWFTICHLYYGDPETPDIHLQRGKSEETKTETSAGPYRHSSCHG
jgi:hypothetical protein